MSVTEATGCEEKGQGKNLYDLLVEVLLHVVGSQKQVDDLGEREHGEPVWDVVLHPDCGL